MVPLNCEKEDYAYWIAHSTLQHEEKKREAQEKMVQLLINIDGNTKEE